MATLFPYTTLFRSLRAWIDQGALWPDELGGKSGKADHWAFKAPVRPVIPQVRNKRWVRNPIDAFILARRSEEHTSELQSRRELVCRLLLEKKKQINFRLALRMTNTSTAPISPHKQLHIFPKSS